MMQIHTLETELNDRIIQILPWIQSLEVAPCDVDGTGPREWIHQDPISDQRYDTQKTRKTRTTRPGQE